MKTRNDFVSNSSSSSFVLRGKDAADGVALFRRLVEENGVPWQVENDIRLVLRAKNRNVRELAKTLGKEKDLFDYGDWRQTIPDPKEDPDELSMYGIELHVSGDDIGALNGKVLRMVEEAEFSVGDGSGLERLVLKMMYLFFERNGCSPDAWDSEQDFMRKNDYEKFICALAGAREGELQ